MRLLIAGGAGFVGSNLCARLLADGHDCICLDNLVTGRLKNIEALISNPAFHFVQHDVIEALPDIRQIDGVIQLASPASPPGYQRFPLETMRVNSEGTLRLLELATSRGVPFVYAS